MAFPTPEVVNFIRRLSRSPQSAGSEQRRYPRFQLHVPVEVISCDEANQPTGVVFTAVVRDLSSSGISFLHPRPAPADRLLVRLTIDAQQLVLALRVVRCRSIGLFYEVAGEFLEKVPTTTAAPW